MYKEIDDGLGKYNFDILYSETQIKLIEMIEKYDFNIYYFECSPKINFQIFLNKIDELNFNSDKVTIIKNLQAKDIYYFYEQKIPELFYSFPQFKNNQYYFDFMLVVTKDKNLNDVLNYNFNLINIDNMIKIEKKEITFDWVQNLFKNRILIENQTRFIDDKNYYNLSKLDYSEDDFIRNYCDNDRNKFQIELYSNINSFIYEKNINEGLYSYDLFKLLLTHIWTFDKEYYIEKNNYGIKLSYNSKYNLNSDFLVFYVDSLRLDESEKLKALKENSINFINNYCDYGVLFSYDACYMFFANFRNIKLYNNGELKWDNLKIVDKTENK